MRVAGRPGRSWQQPKDCGPATAQASENVSEE